MSVIVRSPETDVVHLLVTESERHGWSVHCSFVDASWDAHESSAGQDVLCLSCMEDVTFPEAE